MPNFGLCFRPVHGLIFLFKWVPDTESEGSLVQDSRLEKIFFAKQVRWKTVAYASLYMKISCQSSRLCLAELISQLAQVLTAANWQLLQSRSQLFLCQLVDWNTISEGHKIHDLIQPLYQRSIAVDLYSQVFLLELIHTCTCILSLLLSSYL